MLESKTRILRRVIGLRHFPLFETVDLDEIATLAENVIECAFPVGTEITTAGARPRALHLIVEGRIAAQPTGQTWEAPHVLGALEVFAEHPLQHSTIALTDVRTLQLPAADVGEILEDNFGMMLAVVRELATRLLPRATEHARFHQLVTSRPVGLVERLLVLRQHLPFHQARLQALTTLAKTCEEVSWPAGTVIARPGDANPFGLILLEGRLRVKTPLGEETVQPGGAIGMLETIAGLPHRSLVETDSDVRALRSTGSAILDVLEDHTDVGLAMIRSLASALLAGDASARIESAA